MYGRGDPENEQRCGEGKLFRPEAREADREGRGRGGADPHLSEKARQRRSGAAALVIARVPEKQPSPRERHPDAGAHDRIEAAQRLVGKERDRKARARQRKRHRPEHDARVIGPSALRGLARDLGDGGKERREADRAHDEKRPRKRRAGPGGPAADQEQEKRHRHERPSQVVGDLPDRKQRSADSPATSRGARGPAGRANRRSANRRGSTGGGGSPRRRPWTDGLR